MLEETSQAQGILLKRGSLGLNGIHDVEDKAKRAENTEPEISNIKISMEI